MAKTILDRLEEETFWNLPDGSFLEVIYNTFELELRRLRRAPSASERVQTEERTKKDSSSPSRLLLGEDFDEINRTLVSLLAAKWLWLRDYETFTSNQPEEAVLPPDAFHHFATKFKGGSTEPRDQLLIITLLIIHDLGKDPSLAAELRSKTGSSSTPENHDLVVYDAVKAGLVPCVDMLDSDQKNDLMLCLKTGSQLNIGQLIQAENVPGSLEAVLEFRGAQSHCFDFKFLEQMLDIAGAQGHIDHACAVSFTLPVYNAFFTAYRGMKEIVDGVSTLRQGYDEVLVTRASDLQARGFLKLSVDKPRERTLLRLLSMGRTASREQADRFLKAFNELPPQDRKGLVDGLNVNGYNDGKAILPYYMPALFQTMLKTMQDEPAWRQTAALGSLMRFLSRALSGTHPRPGQKSQIVECNLLFAKETITSNDFRRDPKVLDRLTIPNDAYERN